MIEGEKKISNIKNGLMALSKLKGNSKHAGDNRKSTKKLITIHPEDDMSPKQFNEHKEVDISNANFQIKFLLNGFFENIGDEDKPSNAVDDKLKKLFDQTMNEEDTKWIKSHTKNNANKANGNKCVTPSAHKRRKIRFQSSKILKKMSFTNEQSVEKIKDKDKEDECSLKKTYSSSRNLPNFPKFTTQSNKKRSHFGMKSTNNVCSVTPEFNKKSDPLNKNIEKDVSSADISSVTGGTFHLPSSKKETKNSNVVSMKNPSILGSVYFDTDNSNKTTYHKEPRQTFNSSKRLNKIKNSPFSAYISNIEIPMKKHVKTTKFKKKHSDDSFKKNSRPLHVYEHYPSGEDNSPIKKAKTKKIDHVRFKHPIIEDDSYYPFKAKTLQSRKFKKAHSSLSCCYSKFLDSPSKDIFDIEGLSQQNKDELNFIKNELQNHVYVHDDINYKSKEDHINISQRNNSSTMNDKNETENANNNTNTVNKSSMNISVNEDTNEIVTHKETNSSLPQHPKSIYSRKGFFEDEQRKLQQKGYVYDSLDDEECEDEIEIHFYLEPDSLIVRIIDFVLFWSVLYSVFEIPYRLAHDLDLDCIRTSYFNYYVISEYIIHLILIIDIIISFFKAYRSFDDRIITNSSIIAIKYLKSWFIPDIISAIPFYSILRMHSPQCLRFIPKYYNVGTKPVKYIIILFRLCKVCKIYLNNTWYTAMRTYLLQTEHFYLWFNMYNGILIFFMYVHSMACLFIFFAQTAYESWILNLGYDTSGFSKLYITAFYYVITTVTSTGYGDIPVSNQLEYVYNLFLLAIGVQACSYALSSFVDIINANDDKSVEYVKSCKVLEEIRLTHRMPMKLYNKVSRLLKYRMMYEKKDKNIIIDSLPLKLRNTLIYEMYKPVIQNFIFFKSFDNKDFIVRVLVAFKPIIASKYDILVKEGDYIAEVIFVKTGVLSLEISIRSKDNGSITTGITTNGGQRTKTQVTSRSSYSNLNMIPTRKTSMFMMYTRSNAGIIKQNSNYKMRGSSKMSFNHLTKNLEKEDSDDSYEGDPTKSHIKGKKSEVGVEYIKILEIRKNEHFGDILMFLDRRSPLTVRVKSKKTELFYLEKTDAVEIASTFPVVWRKIIKKSLFNMEQMERLINKAVKVCNRVYNEEGLTTYKDSKFSLSPRNTNKDHSKRMLTLIKETGIPIGNESDELRSIPSSLQSSSKQTESDIQVQHNRTNTNITNQTNKDDSFYEDEDYPPTNATRMKLLAHGQNQSIIAEESEYGYGSEKSKKQNSNYNTNIQNKQISTKNEQRESEGCLIDDDDNSSKFRISIKEVSNHNTISTSTNNNNLNPNYNNNALGSKPPAFTETQITIKVNLESKNIENMFNEENQPITDDSCLSPTPYKFSDINNEFYPCEMNKNEMIPFFKNDNYKINNIIQTSGMLSSLWKAPSPINNPNNILNDLNLLEINKTINNNDNTEDINNTINYSKNFTNLPGLNFLSFNNTTNIIENRKRSSSFDNISICSTTTSLSLSSSYENLNEISGYSYISSPQLQSKVKTMLQLEKIDLKDNTQEEIKSNHNYNLPFNGIRSSSNVVFPRNFIQNNNHNVNGNCGPVSKVGTINGMHGFKSISPRKRLIKSCSVNITENDFAINLEPMNQSPKGAGGGNTKMLQPIDKKRSTVLKHAGNKEIFGTVQPISPTERMSNIGRRRSIVLRPIKQKKTDLLNVISQNIETNNQILNQPGIFCADYFQKVMVNHNNKIEQHNLYKRLLNTEKILNDIDKGGGVQGRRRSGHYSPMGTRGEYSFQRLNKIYNETG